MPGARTATVGDVDLDARLGSLAWLACDAGEARADDAGVFELLDPHRPRRQRLVHRVLHAPRLPVAHRHDIRHR